MISVEEARKTILDSIAVLGAERVDILSALGRTLAENIVSSRNVPPLDNSAMDGYAVVAADTKGASKENPVTLRVLEDLPAGRVSNTKVSSGEAIRIMTGAPVPLGADAVLRVEDTEPTGDSVKIFAEVKEGHDIRRAGEDVSSGDMVIGAGTVIGPAAVGMMASLGKSFVQTYQVPRVAVLSTGDELVEADEEPGPGKIVNSNSYGLCSLVQQVGAIPIRLSIARDTREDLEDKLRQALVADAIITSGGVSVGDYDFVKDVLASMGSEIKFWKVAMRPGKPQAFGRIQGKPTFGLPGNPVSCFVVFEQFVRPALLKMMGRTAIFRRTVPATVEEDVAKRKGIVAFVRARVREDNGSLFASTTGPQGSGMLKSMVLANALLVIPEDVTVVKKGESVSAQILDDSLRMSEVPE